jgi:SAM-dependent methyltransferase
VNGDCALDILARCGRYARWLYDLAAPHLGRRVVEVGAGLGTQSAVMLDAAKSPPAAAGGGREFLLTDSDPSHVGTLAQRFASRPNVRAVEWALPEPFPSAVASDEFRPDTVVGWNVLEHIEDDTRALAEMREALEPGGKVIMFCPAGPGLFGPLDRALRHFRRYARRDLTRKARAAGLVTVLERRVNLAGAVGWLVTVKLFARTDLPEGRSRLFDALVPLFRLWEDRLPIPWGLSVLFVGQKPA